MRLGSDLATPLREGSVEMLKGGGDGQTGFRGILFAVGELPEGARGDTASIPAEGRQFKYFGDFRIVSTRSVQRSQTTGTDRQFHLTMGGSGCAVVGRKQMEVAWLAGRDCREKGNERVQMRQRRAFSHITAKTSAVKVVENDPRQQGLKHPLTVLL
ncbi:hypothetical protein AK812_SmicGene27234 [Symbiodinium microadriaticum]|uniref:Uncharacterized protein n=1 Tax=Symbiodinium microadriaticum TaxID=2951 RepID=A0A1Q9D7E3_SYMMI|nr:hypothetical protein AK812_SmicGene27234 [Symbiodinium microadriaticum]